MDHDFLFDNDFLLRRLARFPNFHHSSPLVYYPQRHIINHYANASDTPRITLFERALKTINSLNRNRTTPFLLSDDPSWFYYSVFSTCTKRTHFELGTDKIDEFTQLLKVAIDDVRADLKSIKESHPGLTFEVSDILPDISLLANKVPELSGALYTRSVLVSIRSKVQNSHVQNNQGVVGPYNFLNYKIYHQGEILFIDRGVDHNLLLLINYDQLLMLVDTVICRLMTRVTVELNEYRNMDNLPSWQTLQWIYSWGDNLLYRYGMNAYAVLGEFESILTGIFVTFEGSDILGLGRQFIESVTQTALEIEELYHLPSSEMLDLVKYLKDIQSVNWLSEIFGLRKHWGNPMVEADKSGRAVQDRLNEELPLSGVKLQELHASFNRMITLEFIRQFGEWPKCSFKSINGGSYPLKEAHTKGVTRIPESIDGHLHSHWALLTFDCNCVIDSFEDELSLLSDKSVSVHRDHINAIYVQALLQPKHRIQTVENRRLILEFLRTSHIPILDIFKVVMTNSVPPEWLVNSAAMKGTEMKHEQARIFAVLTYEIRQYFTATEELIKTHIFRFNPHQTMTLSESELLSRLRGITRQMDPSANSRFLCVLHIIDFSKWNLRMRYANTAGVFKSIDDFLGTPGLIESSHQIFTNMINVVQDAFNPPYDGVLESDTDTVWRLHTAGWEGQRQKGWTVLTSALLSDLERVTGIKSTISGQGDNQTLLSYFPVPENYRNPLDWIEAEKDDVLKFLDKFYFKLESECLSVGLKIKVAESCRSLSYLNYSKRLYSEGCELSMTLKRESKTATEPNGTYPITEMLLKTEEGSAFSAGLYGHPSILPYLVSRLGLLITLNDAFTNNPLIEDMGKTMVEQKGIEYGPKFLNALIKVPASLGGPPQLSFAAYLFRGHPDPTCTDFSMMCLRAKSGCEISQRLISLAYHGYLFNHDKSDKTSLISAPYSLNLKIPQSARDPLNREILPALRYNCKNPSITPLFSFEVSGLESELLHSLSMMTPFHPLIANDIYSRSLPGRRQSFISGLSNTTSLGRLIYESHFNPIINKVRQLEADQLNHWSFLVDVIDRTISTYSDIDLSHDKLVQHCRDLSWDCRIVGITVPHPIEQFVLVKADYDMCSSHEPTPGPEHIVIVRHNEALIAPPGVDSANFIMQRCRHSSPYLGNTISEGIMQRYLSCINPTPSWRDAVRLNVLRHWVSHPNGNLDNVLKEIIFSRTDVRLSKIDLASGRPSRLSYSHRAALMGAVKSSAVSTTTNMHSRLYVSSNKMGRFSHGEFNYHLAYGPAFLCFEALICLDAVMTLGVHWTMIEKEVYHAHLRTEDVPVVYDGVLELLENTVRPLSDSAIPRLLFTPATDLQFTYFSGLTDHTNWASYDSASFTQARMAYANQLLGDSFAYEVVIREQMTSELMESYSHRENSISIGDITMIGVRLFVKALAVNFLLMSPYSLFSTNCNNECSFAVACKLYLETFTSSFWAQFSTALSSARNLGELVNLTNSIASYNMTRNGFGVIVVLKEVIIQEMYQLRKKMAEYFLSRTRVFPFDIYAPSLYALRLLWSKTVELCILSLSSSGLAPFRDMLAYARDFSHNIHSVPLDKFYCVKIEIFSAFSELLIHLGLTVRVPLPDILAFPLTHPWIDKARIGRIINPQTQSPSQLLERPTYILTPDHCSFTFHAEQLVVAARCCDCRSVTRSQSLHLECFYMPTGLLSKSHYKFLDIVMSLVLPVCDIICLGSSTGTEALALSKINTCERVYVNCYFPISSFSAHFAGSYVPPAFVGKIEAQKLVHPSSSAVVSNDLLREETLHAINAHTQEFISPGVTCDAEIPGANFSTITSLIVSIMKICYNRNSIASWVIIKVPAKCYHELRFFVGLLGRLYSNVDAIYSPYTKPGNRLFFLVGRNHFPSVFLNWDRLSSEIPIGLNDDLSLHDFHERCVSRVNPSFSLLPYNGQVVRRALHNFLSVSFSLACNAYVDGLGSCVYSIPSKSDFLPSCKLAIKAIEHSIDETLQISHRAFMQYTMVRNNILQLTTDPLHIALNGMFNKINRLQLLIALLSTSVLNFSHCVEFCTRWFRRAHSYPLRNRQFDLSLETTRFYNFYSRYLFEILGVMFNFNAISITIEFVGDRFHYKRGSRSDYGVMTSLPPLEMGDDYPVRDHRFLWDKRAQVMFCLMCVDIFSNVCLRLFVPSSYSVVEALSDSQLDSEETVITCMKDVGGLSGAWVPDNVDPVSVLPFMNDRFLISMVIREARRFSRFVSTQQFFRNPWTGICPDRVVIMCDKNRSPVELTQYPQPSILNHVFYSTGLSLIGCGCYDCAAEVYLSNKFDVSASRVEMSISGRRLQSLREVSHS